MWPHGIDPIIPSYLTDLSSGKLVQIGPAVLPPVPIHPVQYRSHFRTLIFPGQAIVILHKDLQRGTELELHWKLFFKRPKIAKIKTRHFQCLKKIQYHNLHTWYLRGILTLWGRPSAQTLKVCWSTLIGGSPGSPSSPPSISWNRDLEMCFWDKQDMRLVGHLGFGEGLDEDTALPSLLQLFKLQIRASLSKSGVLRWQKMQLGLTKTLYWRYIDTIKSSQFWLPGA